MGSTVSVCEPREDYKLVVEDSDGFVVYYVCFILMYFAMTVLCGWAIFDFFKSQNWKISFANNRLQVVTFLALGSFVRSISFIPANCITEQVLFFFKDVLFWTSFVLIIVFWVELQKYVRQMQTIQALRPVLLCVIGVFFLCRIGMLAFELLPHLKDTDASEEEIASRKKLKSLGRNICQGGTIIIILGLVGVGVYYGCKLLRKMGALSKDTMRTRLRKLTYFILLEVSVYGVFLLSWLARQTQSGTKEEEPWKWFALKCWEKVLEFLGQLVLCLTMVSRPGKKTEAKRVAQRQRQKRASINDFQRKKQARAASKGTTGGPTGLAKTVVIEEKPGDVETGEVPTSMVNPLITREEGESERVRKMAASAAVGDKHKAGHGASNGQRRYADGETKRVDGRTSVTSVASTPASPEGSGRALDGPESSD